MIDYNKGNKYAFYVNVKALKISFALLAVAAGLVLVELILRFAVPVPENIQKLRSSNLFLHENNPGATFNYASEEYSNVISINSYGFRDDPFSKEKASGVFRIAVLGDSQEEALQVPLEDTWQKVMARELSKKLNRQMETHNFGISGYGTDQQWLTLREKVWQFSPDMVILAFSPNDVGDIYKNKLVRLKDGELYVVGPKERAGGNLLGKLLRETYIYNLMMQAASGNKITRQIADKVRTKILGFSKDERFFLSDAQLVEGPFEVMASKKSPQIEVREAWDVIRALVSDMKKQADEHDAKFMITVNIPRAQVEPTSWDIIKNQYHLTDETASPYEINEVMGRIAKDAGIYFHDGRLEAIDWKNKYGLLHLVKDGHFNKNGNLFMGTKVADFIVENRIIE